MPYYPVSLFIFRRDLRLDDNTALNEALRLSDRVIPCFIFDPRQIDAHPYRSQPGLQFMLESIADLQQQLACLDCHLALFQALPVQLIRRLQRKYQIQAVFVNRDYTPFSRNRDNELHDACRQLGLSFYSFSDSLLTEPEQVVKPDKTPYKVFTAFYNQAIKINIAMPCSLESQRFMSLPSDVSIEQFQIAANNVKFVGMIGGRKKALALFDNLDACIDYRESRDFPASNSTSQLSAHLKFGTCSVREVFYAVVEKLGSEHPLLRQLYWRDFFTHIAYHFPKVFGHTFIDKFNRLSWDNRPDFFQAWCAGKTGFPIVDAGMRELNATGYMHNRVRMISASFLVKDLHISWQWGERYFAQHLVDYDPCVNNGNWQWAASTGCDAQPYFRIFNPWRQQQKFDPDCRYIYRWIPELGGFTPDIIHNWYRAKQDCSYPLPIIDHAIESQVSKMRFKDAIMKNQ